MGGDLGTCFDVSLLHEGGRYRMWFSWRPRRSIALAESDDGVRWGRPTLCVEPSASGWEEDVNRPSVVRADGLYHMWYTGQRGRPEASLIGYAQSRDGVHWRRTADEPVLRPERPWENVAVMCPHVLRDEARGLWRMWYSGGDQNEPNAIGHATSGDGLRWERTSDEPVFGPDPASAWECHKVTAAQVVPYAGGFAMFYIGFRDEDHAQIGLAWSPDGIGSWRRHAENPILSPDADAWDADADYKPFALRDGERWRLWFNGRRGDVEQIGMAVHEGTDLGIGG